MGRAFVTDTEKLRSSSKTRSLEVESLIGFFSEVSKNVVTVEKEPEVTENAAPDRRLECLLSSSVDNTARLWQVGHDECLKSYPHNNYVTCVEFNPLDDNYFISFYLELREPLRTKLSSGISISGRLGGCEASRRTRFPMTTDELGLFFEASIC